MKENYILRRRLKAFSAFIAEHVCVKMRFRLLMFLALCAVSGAWAQTAQVINPTGGTGLSDGLKVQVNLNGALAVYRNNLAQYCCGQVWPNGATGGVALSFRFSQGSSFNSAARTLAACSTTPVEQNGNTYKTSITGWVQSTISSDLFYVTLNVTYTHPNNYFVVDYFVRAPSNLSTPNQTVHIYLDHDANILGSDGSRGYKTENATGQFVGNYRLPTDNSSTCSRYASGISPSTHGFKTKGSFRSYFTGYYGSRNSIGSDIKLSNTVNTSSCIDDGVAVEFTVGPFTTAGQVLAKQVLHGYGNNKGEFDNTPVDDPQVPSVPSSPVTVELTSNAYSESEGNGDHATNTVKIRVSGGQLTQDQVCNFTLHNGTAQQGTHFTYVKGVTIPAGDYNTAKEITLNNITIKDNTTCNNDLTFQISIDDPGQCNDLIRKSPTNNQATVTIRDDEVHPAITTNLPNLEYHYGQTVPAITFATNPTNATVTWTNSNTSIGLNSSSGNGNLPSFTAKNESSAPIMATITATPQGICPGAPKTFTIKVHPKLKITYDYNGGTAPTTSNPATYLYDQSMTIQNEPTRKGYTFKGWTCQELNITTPAKPFVIPAHTDKNLTLRADWGLDSYTITYTLDGGVVEGGSNPTLYDVNTPSFSLRAPRKPGFTFTGWTGSNGTSPSTSVSIPQGSTGNKNYTANWTENTYTISYNYNSGNAPASPNKANYKITEVPFDINSTATANQPTRTGYDFTGWTGPNATSVTKTVHVTNAVFLPTGDPQNLSYTANWTPINYTLTYHLNGGTASNPTNYTIESAELSLNRPTRSGYTFAGWSGTELSGQVMDVRIPRGSTGNREYTANWTPINYTITYLDGSATITVPGAPTQFNDPQLPLTINNEPTKPGWTFTGWTGGAGADGGKVITIPNNTHANQSYTATWSSIAYTITFNPNGGVNPTIQPNWTSYDMSKLPLSGVSVTPTRTGYTFNGWTGHGLTNHKAPFTIASTTNGVPGNLTYTAQWTLDTYNLNYDLGGGTVATANPATYTYTTSTITLNNPTRTGYTFAGWTGTGIVGTSMSVQIPQGSVGHRSYTATWTADRYTITYDLAEGTVTTPNPDEYYVTTPTITLHNPTRSGYTFAGWTGTGISGSSMSVQIPLGSTGNRTYTATWTPITYTIKYVDDDGATVLTTVSAGAPTQFNDTELPKTFSVTATKPGFTFVGWEQGAGASGGPAITIPKVSSSHAHQTYKAIWTSNAYTITFNANGGINPSIPSIWTGYDMPKLPLNNVSVTPTYRGYTFAGWNGHGLTNQTAPFNITSSTNGVPGNLTYIAQWNIITYNITYTLAGGTVSPTNPASYQVTTPAITLNNPTRTGYAFAGWTGTDLTTPSTSVTIPTGSIGDRNYTATWSENGYTITYNLNNGMAPATPNKATFKITEVPFVINTTAPANQPTRTGYDFTGWTGHDLTVANKTINVQASTFSTPGTPENLTYTAHWNPITYTIHYTLDHGTEGAGHVTSYTVETATFNLVPPTRTGWTFVGWTGSNGSVPQTTVTVPQGSTGDLNYTAHWSANAYTITFNPNGGVNPTIPSNLAGYNVTDLPLDVNLTPTRLGYTFKGWTGHGLPGTPDPFRIENTTPGVPGNLTFTATWDLNNYTLHYHLNGGVHVPGNPSTYNVTQLPVDIATEPTHLNPKAIFIGWTCREIPTAPMALTFTIPANTAGDLNFDAHWTRDLDSLNNNHPGKINDTLFVCEGPRILYGDPQGKSWQWILPDGRILTTKNIDAMKSGRYVCSTNYGTRIVNDTLHVYFLMENSSSSIRYITTTGAKLNRVQEFVLDIPREMWPHVTSNWSVSGGGVIRKASADSLMVTWSTMGEKAVTADVTFTYAGIQCSKRVSTNIQISQHSLGFFVNHRATGGQRDGSSWQNAFLNITDALAHATVGDRIWVAQGTYQPMSGRSFEILQDSIEIYGGFEGTEEYLYQRNIALYPTIVKGNGTSVWKVKNSMRSRIDGFVIEDGRAERGAGVLYESASGTVANAIIRDNIATKQGGGIYLPAPLHGHPASLIVNTEISGNQSSEGAGIYNDGGDLQMLNVTVSGNKAMRGGGLYNKASSPVITNTIIWGNVATEDAPATNDVVNDSGSPLYAFSIIGGSRTSGGWNASLGRDSQGNMDRNPLFLHKGFESDGVTMRRGDYKLANLSPAVNGGYNGALLQIKTPWDILLQYPKSSYHSGVRFDLSHKERISDNRVDIGAYESNAGDLTFNPIERPVTLPEVPGLITEPGPGIHMVKGQENFVFTVRPKAGYSLKYLTVTTGIPVRDKHGIIMNKNSDGSVTVTILKVWEALDVSINGVSPVSNASMPQHKVWAHRQHLYIEAQYATIMQLYTLDGKLHTQQMIPQGNTSLPLAAGFYTVVMDGRVYKVMVE
ncbi:repeat protein [Tannerella forsythia KS16]|nr:repeat protein [Tannerella forsythia KS16]